MCTRRAIAAFMLWAGIVSAVLFWNNFVIQSEQVYVSLENLPSAFDGFRVASITDLHGREFEADNRYLLSEIAKLRPDIICISGDLFDENSDVSVIHALANGLCKIAPTFYVTGNHEWQRTDLRQILSELEGIGVTVLQNEYTLVHRGDQHLVIAGVDDPCGPLERKTPQELVQEIRKYEPNSCILMLSHRNDELAMWSDLGVDLVISGHCHGGVVRLPFVGGVFGTNRELFPAYDAGLYAKNGTQLFVSRGLGYSNVRLRLFNRPHLPLLVLQS